MFCIKLTEIFLEYTFMSCMCICIYICFVSHTHVCLISISHVQHFIYCGWSTIKKGKITFSPLLQVTVVKIPFNTFQQCIYHNIFLLTYSSIKKISFYIPSLLIIYLNITLFPHNINFTVYVTISIR